MATDKNKSHDRHEDPITGEPGAHPVGAGVGAAAGGAAAGAALGVVAGPIGTVVGAVAGGIAGGLAGKAVAERIDPTAEDAYWSANFRSRPYVAEHWSYLEYQPAFRYGWESYHKHAGRPFEDVESDLRSDWEHARGASPLTWEQARPATRDAWERLGKTMDQHRLP